MEGNSKCCKNIVLMYQVVTTFKTGKTMSYKFRVGVSCRLEPSINLGCSGLAKCQLCLYVNPISTVRSFLRPVL